MASEAIVEQVGRNPRVTGLCASEGFADDLGLTRDVSIRGGANPRRSG